MGRSAEILCLSIGLSVLVIAPPASAADLIRQPEMVALGSVPTIVSPEGPAPLPPPCVIPAPRRACAPPRLIKSGGGLPLAATTRVVYGVPPCAL